MAGRVVEMVDSCEEASRGIVVSVSTDIGTASAFCVFRRSNRSETWWSCGTAASDASDVCCIELAVRGDEAFDSCVTPLVRHEGSPARSAEVNKTPFAEKYSLRKLRRRAFCPERSRFKRGGVKDFLAAIG